MQEVKAFQANDGQLFDTYEKCAEYEHSLVWKDRIKQFLISDYNEYKGSAQSSMISRSLVNWEMFKIEYNSTLGNM